jgi:OOP family OmpA-OmpF porin
MLKQGILYSLFAVTFLNATSVESQIGINVGMVSTKNEIGSKFKNTTVDVNLRYNGYVVMPRLDLEYVKLKDEKADALIKGSFNGVYEFENSTNVVPYILAGVGYENVQGGEKDVFESHSFVQGGGGLSLDLPDEYKANIEGRLLQIIGGNNEENEAIVTAGIVIPLGDKPRRKKVRAKVVRPIIVASPKVMPAPRPSIIYINKNECSIKTTLPDLDRDGVEDRVDQCPATPCNFTVDHYGCPIKTTLKINFATNSATIKGNSLMRLDRFAKFLLKNKGSMVKIVGHTDSIGSSASNLSLSQRRAQSVVRALLQRGVSSSRLDAEGRGESRPIASNKTEMGRASNRRIEAHLSYPKGER